MPDELDVEHLPIRLTRLETNVSRLTDDVKELTRAVGENIKSQSEIISSLSERVTASRNPDWQVWVGFIAVVITAIGVIYGMIQSNDNSLAKDILHNKEEAILRDEIVSLKLQNLQKDVDKQAGYLY